MRPLVTRPAKTIYSTSTSCASSTAKAPPSTSALLEAHTADTAHQRHTALTTLHTRLRDMAATANDAIGSWPEHGDVPA
ncbi:hypothetical protein AB0368_33190 [Actinoplanes sp. NPDC051475]|uniref:hypothetical protein n=1 Tax=Actinoplanes sp. NPDC051475 TaxID=3157225 RepID=UPI00344C8FBD